MIAFVQILRVKWRLSVDKCLSSHATPAGHLGGRSLRLVTGRAPVHSLKVLKMAKAKSLSALRGITYPIFRTMYLNLRFLHWYPHFMIS